MTDYTHLLDSSDFPQSLISLTGILGHLVGFTAITVMLLSDGAFGIGTIGFGLGAVGFAFHFVYYLRGETDALPDHIEVSPQARTWIRLGYAVVGGLLAVGGLYFLAMGSW